MPVQTSESVQSKTQEEQNVQVKDVKDGKSPFTKRRELILKSLCLSFRF